MKLSKFVIMVVHRFLVNKILNARAVYSDFRTGNQSGEIQKSIYLLSYIVHTYVYSFTVDTAIFTDSARFPASIFRRSALFY